MNTIIIIKSVCHQNFLSTLNSAIKTNLKAHGKSAGESFLMNGYALNTGRAAQGMPLKVSPAKIACLDFNLQKTKMQSNNTS